MRQRRAWPKTLREWRLLARIAALLLALRLVLFRVQLLPILRWLTPAQTPHTSEPDMLEKAVLYTDALLRRLAFPLRGPCLPRALTLYYCARRYGFPVHLHCGVARVKNALQGHAWLSFAGRPFLEEQNPADSYTVTFSFPAIASANPGDNLSLSNE